jgi:hypothetical protein
MLPTPANVGLISPHQRMNRIVANLLELYAHDFSEFHPLELGADGRFGYRHLPLYRSERDRISVSYHGSKATNSAIYNEGS